MIRTLLAAHDCAAWPRLGAGGPDLLPEARDPALWQRLATSPLGRSLLDELAGQARGMAAEPDLVLPFSAFMRFFRDGDRQDYEGHYFARRRRLQAFALAELAGLPEEDPDGKAAARSRLSCLEDTLWAICDEYSWCLPAHLDPPAKDSGAASGPGDRGTVHRPAAPVPSRDPASTVDLFSAETAAALAEILGLLGDRLSPELAWRLRDQVRRRVLDQFTTPPVSQDAIWSWETATHNWAAVCGGSVGIAALWLVDDRVELQQVLARVGGALESYLSGFAPDGICQEGMGYWTYGFGYFLAFAELLRERSGGRLDLLGHPELRPRLSAIAAFPAACRIGLSSFARFSDAPDEFRYPPGILCRLASRLDGVPLPPPGLAEALADDPCARFSRHLRDLVWLDPGRLGNSREAENPPASPDSPFPGETWTGADSRWFPDAQWLVHRDNIDGIPWGLAAKAGHNAEPHNHNDVGSFMLVAGEDVLLDDLGAGRYERDYFREGRYGYFVNASRSHNLPLVDGREQAQGRERSARSVVFDNAGGQARLAMDLAPAYGLPELRELIRKFQVGTGNGKGLILEDSFRFGDQREHQIRERFVSHLPVQVEDASSVWVRGAGFVLAIQADRPADRIEVHPEVYAPHEGPERQVHCVDFCYRSAGGSAAMSFRLQFSQIRRIVQ